MESQNELLNRRGARSAHRPLGGGVASLASDLLPLFDLVLLFLAASLASVLYSQGLPSPPAAAGLGNSYTPVVMLSGVLAPFLLYDQRFGAIASVGRMWVLARTYALRFALFCALVLSLGSLSHAMQPPALDWVLGWLVAGLLLTTLPRALAALVLRGLQHRGALTEVIAIVGADRQRAGLR